jgi:hypothetical protein
MQFRVRFYFDADGNKPIIAFLEDLRKQDRIVPKRMAFCDVVLMELTAGRKAAVEMVMTLLDVVPV